MSYSLGVVSGNFTRVRQNPRQGLLMLPSLTKDHSSHHCPFGPILDHYVPDLFCHLPLHPSRLQIVVGLGCPRDLTLIVTSWGLSSLQIKFGRSRTRNEVRRDPLSFLCIRSLGSTTFLLKSTTGGFDRTRMSKTTSQGPQDFENLNLDRKFINACT